MNKKYVSITTTNKIILKNYNHNVNYFDYFLSSLGIKTDRQC